MWLLCLMLWQKSFAEDGPVYHPIDRSDWKEATDGVSYYEKRDEPVEQKIEQQKTPEAPVEANSLLQIVAFSIIIALLVFILIRLFGKGIFSNRKVDPVVVSVNSDLDDRPMETDLERYLREALEKNDFRMAIRIYYLMVLKALHDGGRIEWRKEKTNRDYLTELYQHPHIQKLSNSTLLFEYVWYGDKKVNAGQFNVIKPEFTDLIQKVSRP
jgi:hypothetical protein